MAIFTVCGDPGGAAALAPVIRHLGNRSHKVTNFAYNSGRDVLGKNGISYEAIPEIATHNWISERFSSEEPLVLLTATSHNDFNWEKLFIDVARKQNVPSLAVLDYWSSYTQRFSREISDLTFLPTRIAVMDSNAKTEMIALGIPEERIVVTGQPAFENLQTHRKESSIKSDYGIDERDLLIVFASQPLRSFNGGALGFDEHIVLRELISALESINFESEVRLTLVIRPHPREKSGNYTHYRSQFISILVQEDGNSHDWLMGADLVVGMNTALLIDSCLLGRPTLSLQPDLKTEDSLPTNKWGASYPVYQKRDIVAALKNALFDLGFKNELRSRCEAFGSQVPRDASEKIVKALFEIRNEQ